MLGFREQYVHARTIRLQQAIPVRSVCVREEKGAAACPGSLGKAFRARTRGKDTKVALWQGAHARESVENYARHCTDNAPDPLGFYCLVGSDYVAATRYKTIHCWLHRGYMSGKRKKPTTKLIAGFRLSIWGG